MLHGPNPVAADREVLLTRLLADKDFIDAVAGRIVKMRAFEKVLLGDDAASENLVLGQAWKTMMDTVLQALATHIHPTGVGPSGTASNAAVYTDAASNLADQLCDWIFTQKDVPVP